VFVVDSGNVRVQQFMPAEEGEELLKEEAEAAALTDQSNEATNR
jgi:fatty acid-binding protein DegV